MAEFRPPERKLYFVINLYEHVRKPQKYQSFTDAVCHVMGRSQRHTQFEEGLLLKSTEPHGKTRAPHVQIPRVRLLSFIVSNIYDMTLL